MIALAVSLALFTYFLVLGLGVSSLLPSSFSAGMRIRLSPGIGIGFYIIFAVGLSRWGLPVKSFGNPLAAVLFVTSLLCIVKRPPLPSRAQLLGIIGPAAVAIVLVGSPMLTFGYHWLSFANDDMANYALSAQRYVDTGYFTPPGPQTFLADKELNRLYWGLEILQGERAGVDIILASASNAVHRNTVEIFMPLIFCGFLAMVLAAGAIGLPDQGELLPALISFAVAASPLAALGMFYQLLAQVFGVVSLCTVAALTIGPPGAYASRPLLVRTATVTAVAGCGLVANYPELLPFLVLGILGWIVARRRLRTSRWQLANIGLASTFALVVLNGQAIAMLRLLAIRLHQATGFSWQLFPYYLLPSGLANLWGLQPIATFYQDPLQSILIALAIVLTVATLAAGCFLILRTDTPAAPVFFAFVAYAAAAAKMAEAFALFKIAMYIQPFMLAVVASAVWFVGARVSWKSTWIRRIGLAAPMVVLMGAGLPALGALRDDSMDRHTGPGAAFTEIAYGSADGVTRSLAADSVEARGRDGYLSSDTSNIVIAKLQAAYLPTHSLDFPSTDFIRETSIGDLKYAKNAAVEAYVGNLMNEEQRGYEMGEFNYNPAGRKPIPAQFPVSRRSDEHDILLITSHDLEVLNRSEPLSQNSAISMAPLRSLSGHLTFVTTDLGSAAGTGNRRRTTLFELEPDYFFRGRTMASVGRFLLFAYDGPPGPIRLLLDISASLADDGECLIPRAVAVGTRRGAFHAVGRGSARLISDPIEPVAIGGRRFVGIDMGPHVIHFADHRTGLMKLYGGWLTTDPRTIVGFARDISVAPPATVRGQDAPTGLSRFPQDVANPALLYSGIYEDGWMSEDAFFRLAAPTKKSRLKLSALVPLIEDRNFSTSATITVDGRNVGTWPAPIGTLTIDVPVEFSRGNHDVRVQFQAGQALPGGDGRVVAARLTSVEFE